MNFAQADDRLVDRLAGEIRQDLRHHYSIAELGHVALGFGITGVMAQSRFDGEVQDLFNDKLQGRAGDELTRLFTGFGDVAHPVSAMVIYGGAMWLGRYGNTAESSVGRWGDKSLRAMLIATPQLVALANIAGGHRPEEGEPGWNPFDDDNGVSGHVFFGAVPLLTAARMSGSRPWRYALYAMSIMPGLARVYDNKHYFSQAFMGWWLANAASRSVDYTNAAREENLSLEPLILDDGIALQVSLGIH